MEINLDISTIMEYMIQCNSEGGGCLLGITKRLLSEIVGKIRNERILKEDIQIQCCISTPMRLAVEKTVQSFDSNKSMIL